MWDIAPEFNAMLVFAEHRFYGESLPFGKDSYKVISFLAHQQISCSFIFSGKHKHANKIFCNLFWIFKDAAHLGYLTSEQALADFATLIDHLKVHSYF